MAIVKESGGGRDQTSFAQDNQSFITWSQTTAHDSNCICSLPEKGGWICAQRVVQTK